MKITKTLEKLRSIWSEYSETLEWGDYSAPLFEHCDLVVETMSVGKHRVLKRTAAIDKILTEEAAKVRDDYKSGSDIYEGFLYILHVIEAGERVPVYIGISEKMGKKGALSTLFQGNNKKPRWDYYPQFHIGDLSSVVVPGPSSPVPAKTVWADCLFHEYPSDQPKLKQECYLWVKAWRSDAVSIWKNLGHSALNLEEALLIATCDRLYPSRLLNKSGILRK